MMQGEPRLGLRGRKVRSRRRWSAAWLTAFLCLLAATGSEGHLSIEELKDKISVQPRFDQQVPADLRFRDSEGRTVILGDIMKRRPTLLAMVYYRCPMLCSLLMKGLMRGLNGVALDMGMDFQVVTVSVDPSEGPADAAAMKREMAKFYERDGFGDGWHFLTGGEEAVRRLASAAGIHYAYDAEQKQYAHPAAVVVLTPGGKISRYLYGLDFIPQDVRLSLVEAAGEKIGTLGDQIFLLCYQYDPIKGKYGLAIMNVLRAAGVMTLLGLGAFWTVMFRRERHQPGGR